MTRNSEDKKGKIGTEVINNLYTSPRLMVADAQPHFILHRDTLRAFLFEKLGIFGLRERILGWIGVEVSVVATLTTTTFHDWHGISANVIQAVFLVVGAIIGVLFMVDCLRVVRNWSSLSVDALTDDLGGRGAILKPDNGEEVSK